MPGDKDNYPLLEKIEKIKSIINWWHWTINYIGKTKVISRYHFLMTEIYKYHVYFNENSTQCKDLSKIIANEAIEIPHTIHAICINNSATPRESRKWRVK